MFEFAMIALDMASAGVANMIAKGVEGALKRAAKSSDPKTVAMKLGDSTVYGISDALKEGLKIGSKRARPSPGSGNSEKPDRNGQQTSSDPRSAFLQRIRDSHDEHKHDRAVGAVDSAALLRPTLHRNPELAITALQAMTSSLKAEAGHAQHVYYEATIRRWFAFLSELKLDLHRVGSVDGRPIGQARGVVDIGFQSGRSPRDPVIVKSAIMRDGNASTGWNDRLSRSDQRLGARPRTLVEGPRWW
jgi:hypothetical protein